MKKLVLTFAATLFIFGFTFATVVDNDNESTSHQVSIKINTHALVDVEDANGEATTINLNPTAPTEAGLGLDFSNSTDNSLWLNYSSIVSGKNERSVSASISGNLPNGVSLSLATGDDAGKGKGKTGEAVNDAQVLTSSGTPIVSKIGSCYTGTGDQAGNNLTYSLKMDESKYDKLVSGTYSITVNFTITED